MEHDDTMRDAAGIEREWRRLTTARSELRPAYRGDTHCRACHEPLGEPSADNPITVVRLYTPLPDTDDKWAPGWQERRWEYHLWHCRCFDARYTTAQTL